jgi:peptidoglycan/LPS O-acetylase OafA/YrhL
MPKLGFGGQARMRAQHTFSALDGFRGVIALCVCLHHTKSFWGIAVPRSAVIVDLFFLVGGFVIAHAYERRLLDGRISFGDFVLIRLIRLYPLYLVSVLIVAVPMMAALLLHRYRPEHITLEYLRAVLLGLLMLPARISDAPDVLYPLNIAYWSLLWAMVTNFLYARLIHWLTDKVLFVVAIAAAGALTVLTFLNGDIGLGQLWGWLSLSGGLARAVFGMSMGVLIFRNYKAVPQWLAGGGYLLPLAIIMLLIWAPAIGGADWLLQLFAVFLVFPWCVVRAARGPQPAGNRLLQSLGFVSYPIYVLHVPFAHLLDVITSHRMSRYAPLSGMVMIILMIGLVMFVDRRLDRPLRSWLTAKAFGPVKNHSIPIRA